MHMVFMVRFDLCDFQDVKAMALACCKTASTLHAEDLVYRDFRSDNVVRFSPDAFIVLDVETVGSASARLPKELCLNGWDDGTLDDGCYTKLSDMYQIGNLLESQILPLVAGVSGEATSFVQQLKAKELSAEEALAHSWLHVGK